MEAKNILFKSTNSNRTSLDKAYNKHMISVMESLDEDKQARWETYNLVVEVLTESTKMDYMKEIKYRLTDGEDPNKVMLDIIDRESDNIDGLVWFLKKRIEEYNSKTAAVASFYESQNKLKSINGIGSIPDIFTQICLTIDSNN